MTIQERAIRRRMGRGVEVSQRKVAPPPPSTETPPEKSFNPEGLPIKHVPFEDMYPKLATLYNRPAEWDSPTHPEAPTAPEHPVEAAEIVLARKAKHCR